MAKKQQDLGKIPEGLPLTISIADEVDLSNLKNVDELMMSHVMITGSPVNVTVDHETRKNKNIVLRHRLNKYKIYMLIQSFNYDV